MTPISNTEKLACATRELKMRRQVYPNRIETGRMSREKAAYEIRVMEQIVEDYTAAAEKEKLI